MSEEKFLDDLFSEEIERFIERHAEDDASSLRLKYAGDKLMSAAILQIELRKKFARKFSALVLSDNRVEEEISLMPARFPSALSAEQATAASIARYHSSFAVPGSSLLDMTMGIGIDSAAFVCFKNCKVIGIERNKELAGYSRRNYAKVGDLEITCADSIDWLGSTDRKFDMIFIDPARRDTAGNRVYNLHDCTPDITEILPLIYEHTDNLLVKLSPMLDVKATLMDLPGCVALKAVESVGECRELLAVCRRDACEADPEQITISAVDADGAYPEFKFSRSEESEAEVRYRQPHVGDILFEPSAAAMKAGGFKTPIGRFNLYKLHPNTHLYVSSVDELTANYTDFPGKRYEITAVLPFSSGELKRFARTWGNASVSVRNFPMSAEKLRAKLGCRESSEQRLIAVTTADGSRAMLLVRSW